MTKITQRLSIMCTNPDNYIGILTVKNNQHYNFLKTIFFKIQNVGSLFYASTSYRKMTLRIQIVRTRIQDRTVDQEFLHVF